MTGTLTGDLTLDELNWQPQHGHHSIWHHVWHMFLSNDFYFAAAMDTEPVWHSGAWSEHIDLARMAPAFEYEGDTMDGPLPNFIIFNVPDSLVDRLKSVPLGQYLAYVDDLIARTTRALESATEDQLQKRVTFYGVRRPAYALASDFSHAYRHIGMMEDLRGLLRGPGAGTASI